MVQEVQPVNGLKETHRVENRTRSGQEDQHPEPCVIVIFGATGDLTQRKLLPTLAHLWHAHPLPQGFSIIGFARAVL